MSDTLTAALRAAVLAPSWETKRAAATEVARLRLAWDDLAGEDPGYLLAIQTAYRAAEVPSDSRGKLQAGIRYHLGEVIRTLATAEDLAAAGLDLDGPAARARRRRMVA